MPIIQTQQGLIDNKRKEDLQIQTYVHTVISEILTNLLMAYCILLYQFVILYNKHDTNISADFCGI